MAAAVTLRPQTAVEAMEEAVHLLRQAPANALLWHWTGSVPFGLALLRFWNDVSDPKTSGTACLAEALLLALLLGWMNSWRAVFAGRLRRRLSGAPDGPWTVRRAWRLAAGQTFLGATKLVAMPVAALVMFPFAEAVAFYRNAAVLADREDLDPDRLMAEARKLARFDARQNWGIQSVLTLVAVAAFVNVAAALAVLPYLVRMFTGYESAFTRNGPYFLTTPLFPIVAAVATWLALDPFIQAVYCVRCFHGESVETGEDVRAGLRRIRAAAVLALAVLLAAPAARAQYPDPQIPFRIAGPPADARGPEQSRDREGAVSPQYAAEVPQRSTQSPALTRDDLEKAVQQAAQAPEYDWRLPSETRSGNAAWVIEVTDRMLAAVRSAWRVVSDALGRLVRWLLRQLQGILPESQGGAMPGRAMPRAVLLLLAVVACGLAVALWRARRLRLKRRSGAGVEMLPAVHLESEEISPDRLPEEEWTALAERCLGEGKLRLALRALYLANLAWLGRRELITINQGKTNREYEAELRRRTKGAPAARNLFAENVAAFERTWYGLHEVSGEELEAFRHRTGQLKEAAA